MDIASNSKSWGTLRSLGKFVIVPAVIGWTITEKALSTITTKMDSTKSQVTNIQKTDHPIFAAIPDEDGLQGVYEQQIINNRNVAMLTGRFYQDLLQNGLPEFVAAHLAVRQYEMMSEDEDMEWAAMFDEDD